MIEDCSFLWGACAAGNLGLGIMRTPWTTRIAVLFLVPQRRSSVKAYANSGVVHQYVLGKVTPSDRTYSRRLEVEKGSENAHDKHRQSVLHWGTRSG